jgi:hypothetical protein
MDPIARSFERTLGDIWGTRLGEWPVLERSEGRVVHEFFPQSLCHIGGQSQVVG